MKAIEKRRQMAGQGGFTLIELLVVIAILGVLAGVVVFAVGNVQDGANENACAIERRIVQTAIQAYRGDNNGTLPPDVNALVPEWLESAPTLVTVNFATGAVSACP